MVLIPGNGHAFGLGMWINPSRRCGGFDFVVDMITFISLQVSESCRKKLEFKAVGLSQQCLLLLSFGSFLCSKPQRGSLCMLLFPSCLSPSNVLFVIQNSLARCGNGSDVWSLNCRLNLSLSYTLSWFQGMWPSLLTCTGCRSQNVVLTIPLITFYPPLVVPIFPAMISFKSMH